MRRCPSSLRPISRLERNSWAYDRLQEQKLDSPCQPLDPPPFSGALVPRIVFAIPYFLELDFQIARISRRRAFYANGVRGRASRDMINNGSSSEYASFGTLPTWVQLCRYNNLKSRCYRAS